VTARRLAVLLLAALALLVAGCGGDDSDSSASGDDAAVVETETTATTDDTATEEEDATTDDGTAALTGECANFAGLAAKLQTAFAGTTGIDSAAEVFDEVADQVPEEIRDDYQVLADNFKELADALKGIDLTSGETPSPEALAKLQELSTKLDTPEVRQATENLEAWARENC
jgi:hypothetical protein